VSNWANLKINSMTAENAQIRSIVRMVVDSLVATKRISKTKEHLFQIHFYNYLKLNIHKFDLVELQTIIMSNTSLLDAIVHRQYNLLESALNMSAPTQQFILFITIFYDNYYQSHSLYKAVRKTMRSPLSKFTREFLHTTLLKYPYLRTKKHLDHVTTCIDKTQFAYVFTQYGPQEVYSV
jgi:hypothetical protein